MIRTYTPVDAEAVVALALRAWAPVFASIADVLGDALHRRVYPDWRASQAEAVTSALDKHDTWLSEAGGAVTGFVNVTFDEAERTGEIHMIAVDPAAQGRGSAALLIARAEDEMRARGCDLSTIATGGDPGHAPARRAYEKAGYTPFPQVWYAKLLDP